ncbi:ATP synthase d subunit [Umbelopsis nana]
MASARAAVKHIDWSKLTVSLPKETAASLQAFRKRNDEARRVLNELKQQRTDVDFDHYRKTLKNQSIVDDAQKALTGFKAATYSVDAQLQAIDQFEAKAVAKAQNTVQQIDAELKDLNATLANIEQSRPIEHLTVDDIIAAKPELIKDVEKSLEKGQFTVPGYKEKFGDISYF